MGGDGGWVGGHRGNAPQQRRDSETLTVYCSQARCPLPGYRCDCVLTSRHSRPQRQGCLCFRPEAGTRVGKAGQEADGGEVGGGGGGVGLRGEAARRSGAASEVAVWACGVAAAARAAATAPGLRLFVLGALGGVAGVWEARESGVWCRRFSAEPEGERIDTHVGAAWRRRRRRGGGRSRGSGGWAELGAERGGGCPVPRPSGPGFQGAPPAQVRAWMGSRGRDRAEITHASRCPRGP